MDLNTPEDHSYITDISNGVLTVSLNKPDSGNAMTSDMVPPLTRLFLAANADPTVRAIHVRGNGKTFSAGGNVAGFAPTLDLETGERQDEFRVRISRLCALVEAVMAFEEPLMVSMRGAVAGAGLLFPLAADYVIGDTTTLFAFAHQSIALSPDGGVSALLPRVVGQRAARGLIVTAAKVKAEEALRLGLINQLVETEALETTADKLANRLARAPRRAVKQAKRLVNESHQRSLTDQLEAETAGIVDCVADEDFAEGVRAFIEKRSPDFPSTK